MKLSVLTEKRSLCVQSFLIILSPVVVILQLLLFSVVLCLYHVIVLFRLVWDSPKSGSL